MDLDIYQIKITGEDGITLLVYHIAPLNREDIILDFMWQEYFEFQPDKSLYKIINLSNDNNAYHIPRKLFTNPTHFHLAVKAIEYVEEYS